MGNRCDRIPPGDSRRVDHPLTSCTQGRRPSNLQHAKSRRVATDHPEPQPSLLFTTRCDAANLETEARIAGCQTGDTR